MPEDIDLGNGFMLRRLPEGDYTYPKAIPVEADDLNTDPFARAAARVRQSVKGRQQLPVDEPAPYKAPNYLIEPDLLEAQQGAHLPTGIAYNDAGIPFNKETGKELVTVPRPNVLPIAKTPEGLTLAMPKAMDVFGNMMGGVAGAPVKGAEVLLGSGPVRKSYQEILEAQRSREGLQAAIKNKETGEIKVGADHASIVGTQSYKIKNYPEKYLDFGFVDNKGKFLSRTQAERKYNVYDADDLTYPKSKTVMFRSDTRNQVYSEVGRQLEKGPFFSALEKAVDTAKVGKASADQWLGYLKNQPGVKQEELATVLGGMEGQLTKQQVQELVKQNKVELGEVIKGNTPIITKPNPDEPHILEVYHPDDPTGEINGMWGEIIKKDGKFDVNIPDVPRKSFGTQAAAEAYIAKQTNLGSNTKYHSYQLPGAENYKEMLLTLPDKRAAGPKTFKEFAEQNNLKDGPDARLAYSEFNANNQAVNDGGNFKSSHWDEPNIIAHIRHNDRMVDGKKTLHLEEIQSDWHQKGRNEGYKLSDKQLKDLDAIENKLTSKLTEAEIGNPDIDNVLKVAVEKKVITQDEAKNYKDYVKGENSTVPDAPFKKNWDELALKRMLHKAATEGYEGISWTPGEAQAARYDLSKQVDSLKIYKSENGNYEIHGKKLGNKDFEPLAKDVSPQKLEETVGKEMAQKILDREKNTKPYEPVTKLPEGYGLIRDRNGSSKSYPWGEWGITTPDAKSAQSFTGRYHATEEEAVKAALEKINGEARHKYDSQNNTFENADLKIGGEGMKSFYDKMLVDKANALGKKYGAKVEQRKVTDNSKDFKIQSDPIAGGYEIIKAGKTVHAAPTKEAANAWIAEHGAQPIHYLPITPELRAKAKEGFPMFSFTPTTIPVDGNPFEDRKKQYKLTPVPFDPFNR